MRKSSDFSFITSKHPLLMSQLPFEQYLMIFKLIKTEQQYSPILTQVSPGIWLHRSFNHFSNRERTLVTILQWKWTGHRVSFVSHKVAAVGSEHSRTSTFLEFIPFSISENICWYLCTRHFDILLFSQGSHDHGGGSVFISWERAWGSHLAQVLSPTSPRSSFLLWPCYPISCDATLAQLCLPG